MRLYCSIVHLQIVTGGWARGRLKMANDSRANIDNFLGMARPAALAGNQSEALFGNRMPTEHASKSVAMLADLLR